MRFEQFQFQKALLGNDSLRAVPLVSAAAFVLHCLLKERKISKYSQFSIETAVLASYSGKLDGENHTRHSWSELSLCHRQLLSVTRTIASLSPLQ